MESNALDTQLEVVASGQRRELLCSLLERSPQDDGTGRVPTRGEEKRRLTEMVHCHLPKLASTALVTWDRDTGRVSRGPKFDDIRPLLALLEAHTNELSTAPAATPD